MLRCLVVALLLSLTLAPTLAAAEADALRIDFQLQQRHMPYDALLDPIFTAPYTEDIQGYTHCGDSALWTGFYLAAESYRWAVTKDADASVNAWRALSGLRSLIYVTGTNMLARCAVPVQSPYAGGIASEEGGHGVFAGIYEGNGYQWVGETSRDQYIGAFFGLLTAWDYGDPAMRPTIADLTWRLIDYLDYRGWDIRQPGGEFVTTFTHRPDQKLFILAVGRHILPDKYGGDYSSFATFNFYLVPLPIAVEVTDVFDSYFKFNLDTVALVSLIRLENNPTRRSMYEEAYETLRNTTDDHANAHFNMMDRALKGRPDARRDAETVDLLQRWLERPQRDYGVNLAGVVPICGNYACNPVPVEKRVPTDFLWQRSPFQISGGGNGFVESAGIDYLLPYWMARFYGVITQSSDDTRPRSRRDALDR